jgi:hypothetical protein
LADGQHDRGKVGGLVGVALHQHGGKALGFQRLLERLGAVGAERVGRVDDRPLLLLEVGHAEFGDHLAGEAVVRAAAKEPAVAHVGQGRVGAADHHRLADLQNVGRHGVHLRAADGADERGDVGLRGQPAEGKHGARVGGLIVLDDQLHLLAQHALLVDDRERLLGALQLELAGFGGRAGRGEDAADADGFGRAGDMRRREQSGGTQAEAATRDDYRHLLLPRWPVRPNRGGENHRPRGAASWGPPPRVRARSRRARTLLVLDLDPRLLRDQC